MNKMFTYNLQRNFIYFNRNYANEFMNRSFHTKEFVHSALFGNRRLLLNKKLPILYHYGIFKNISEDSFVKKSIKKIKFELFVKAKLQRNACLFYTQIDKNIDIQAFFNACQMPDTFYSWYLINELHIWMLCVRFMAEGEKGKVVRNEILKTLWLDIDERSKKLEGANVSSRKQQANETKEHFRASFFSYDEALNGDDKILASALWRIIFFKNCEDPERLECCVHYVRKNLLHLDTIPFEEMILNSRLEFLPLLEPSQMSSIK